MAVQNVEWNHSFAVDTFIFKASSLGEELRTVMKELWKSKNLADFTINARGKHFKTHKVLLVAHSAYFREYANLGSKSQASIDVDPEMLNLILKYLYNGTLEIPRNQAGGLGEAAGILGVESLKSQCKFAVLLRSEVTPDNCCEMWEAAYKNKDQKLATKAMQITLENFPIIQHDPQFKQLPLECLIQCVGSPELKVSTPDERLAGCVNWIKGDPRNRAKLMSRILDILPMADMQDWYLNKVLQDPTWVGQEEVRKKLQAAVDTVSRIRQSSRQQTDLKKPPIEPVVLKSAINKKQQTITIKTTCLIATGISKWNGTASEDATDEVFMVLDVNLPSKVIRIGKLGTASTPHGIAVCANENQVFISGMGSNADEIWTCVIAKSKMEKCQRVEKMTLSRVGHCMYAHEGVLHIIGGFTNCSNTNTCTDEVEVMPCKEPYTSPQPVGVLQYKNILDSDGAFCNLACCFEKSYGNLIVYGAFVDEVTYKHTVQIYSLSEKQVTHTLVVPRVTEWAAYSVLPVGNKKLILIACEYTAVCSIYDILNERSECCQFCDKYVVPNVWCAVLLSEDGVNVMLYGGVPKPGRPKHYMYTAPVTDILQNIGPGWKRIPSEWPLGDCWVFGYDAVKM